MKRILVLVCLLLAASSAHAQSAEDLFQQALRVERVSSNPEAAIALYQQIVELPGADRELVAQAWLEMGKAYEVLGEEGAVRAYTRVVRDYGEFSEVARDAAARMEGLAARHTSISASETMEAKLPGSRTVLDLGESWEEYGATFSPSGRYLAFPTDYKEIQIVDVSTSERRTIEVPMVESQWIDYLAFSPDETKITTLVNSRDEQESSTIAIVDLETGGVNRHATLASLFPPDADFACGFGAINDWSFDATKLLIHVYWKSGQCTDGWTFTSALAIVPLNGGAVEFISEVEGEKFGGSSIANTHACFSADGRHVLAEVHARNGGANQPAFIRRFDVGSGGTVVWRKGGVETGLFACTWNPGTVLYAQRTLGGIVLRHAEATSLDKGNDPVATSIALDSWAVAFSKQGDFALEVGSASSGSKLHVVALDGSGAYGNSTTVDGAHSIGFSMSPTGIVTWTTRARDVLGRYDVKRRQPLSEVKLPVIEFGGQWWRDESRMVVRSRSEFEAESRSTPSPHDYVEGSSAIWDTIVMDVAGNETARLTAERARAVGVQWAVPLDGDTWLGWLPDMGCWGSVDVGSGDRDQMFCPTVRDLRQARLIVSPFGPRAITWLWDKGHEGFPVGILDVETGDHRPLDLPRDGVVWITGIQWLSSTEVLFSLSEPSEDWRPTLIGAVVLDIETGEVVRDLEDLVSGISARSILLAPDGDRAVVYGSSLGARRELIDVVHNVLGVAQDR